jgi:hypothetical protein
MILSFLLFSSFELCCGYDSVPGSSFDVEKDETLGASKWRGMVYA